MANNICLGIYYHRDGLTAAPVIKEGQAFRLGSSLKWASVVEGAEEGELSTIERLSVQLQQEQLKLPRVALALSGQFYQVQFHHSKFAESSQLDQTLRFDIEEAVAGEAESLLLCYQHRRSGGAGSDLLVYTAEKGPMVELLGEFERAHLDALVAEPDLAAWVHFLKHESALPAGEGAMVLGCAFDSICLLAVDGQHKPVLARSFLRPRNGAKSQLELLGCELRRSLSLLHEDQQPQRLFYHSDGFVKSQIEGLSRESGLACEQLAESDASRAFAAGAALGWLADEERTDFRADGMEPHTLKEERRKGWFGFSASISFLLLSLVIVLCGHLSNYEGQSEKAGADMLAAWQQTHPGQKPLRSVAQIPSKMRAQLKELRRQSAQQSGPVLPDSASHTLLLLLRALEKLPKGFDLEIDSLRFSADSLIFSGSVRNLGQLEEFVKAISSSESRLEIVNWDFRHSGSGSASDPSNRREFNIPLRVKGQ